MLYYVLLVHVHVVTYVAIECLPGWGGDDCEIPCYAKCGYTLCNVIYQPFEIKCLYGVCPSGTVDWNWKLRARMYAGCKESKLILSMLTSNYDCMSAVSVEALRKCMQHLSFYRHKHQRAHSLKSKVQKFH